MHKMSEGEVRKVSRQDIQLVQNLIERCLQLYMNQKEVVQTLEQNARIEPGFTELVWQKLEEENREFFKAYHVRLILKEQISIFNQLLQKQVELMHGMSSAGAAAVSLRIDSNTSHFRRTKEQISVQQAPSCYISVPSRCNDMSRPVDPSGTLLNGGPTSLECIAPGNTASLHTGGTDLPTSLLSTQSPQMAMPHRMSGTPIKIEPTFSSNSDFTFCTDSSFSEGHATIGDASLPSFSGTDLNAQSLNDPLLDIDASSFGFLGQIPRNFSFSDLTEDFSQSTDILESYGRSPFLGPESSNLSTLTGRKCNGESRILDTISEGVNIDDFGSD